MTDLSLENLIYKEIYNKYIFLKNEAVLMWVKGMEKWFLTKSQRKVEINELYYINLWQKEEQRSNEGSNLSSGDIILKLDFPHL